MRKLCIAVNFISLLAMLLAVACGAQSGSTEDGSEHMHTAPLTGSEEDFKRAQFDDPTRIDNRWLPLTPGTQLVYEGSAIDDGERISRRVVTTVTDLSKVIDDVRTLVIWERDFTAGQLSEPELAFFAQDNAGNVWLVGEYPEEYDEGEFWFAQLSCSVIPLRDDQGPHAVDDLAQVGDGGHNAAGNALAVIDSGPLVDELRPRPQG